MQNFKALHFLGFFVATISLSACGGKKVSFNADNYKATKNPLFEAQVGWVEDKEDKYDFELTLRNLSKTPAIVYLSDIRCKRGGMEGRVTHTFFNTGERTMDFKPFESKTNNMVCRFGNDQSGDYLIQIARVYDNPSGDGAKTGKVIAKNIEVSITTKKD